MNRIITKATVSTLLALVCLVLFASSVQAVHIRAETGAPLPSSIIVDEDLTVLITDDYGTPINGTAENAIVRYILPADGGTPIPVGVGSDGKTVNPYKPPMTGVLNITVSYETTLMASQTVNVATSTQAVRIRAETGAPLPSSIIVDEDLTVLITDDYGTPINGTAENAIVRYILPADGGTPIPVGVGSDGKTVNPYKPLMTGVLNITVSYGTTLMASQTVEVVTTDPSPCYIATATYGTPLDSHINVLRNFRDELLLTNPIGGAFVSTYYTTSPPIADALRGNDGLRTVTRLTLITPLVYLSKFLLNSILVVCIFIIGSAAVISLRTGRVKIVRPLLAGTGSILVFIAAIFSLGFIGYAIPFCATVGAYLLPFVIPLSVVFTIHANNSGNIKKHVWNSKV